MILREEEGVLSTLIEVAGNGGDNGGGNGGETFQNQVFVSLERSYGVPPANITALRT